MPPAHRLSKNPARIRKTFNGVACSRSGRVWGGLGKIVMHYISAVSVAIAPEKGRELEIRAHK